MGEGRGRKMPVNEAFRCHGANLLPSAKFIGIGLFIKCLGQVDLPNAPLRHRSHVSHTPLFPWFSLKSLVAELAISWK